MSKVYEILTMIFNMIFNNPLKEFSIWRSKFEAVIKALNNGETFPNLTKILEETN